MSHPFTHRHLRHLPTFGYSFPRVSPASNAVQISVNATVQNQPHILVAEDDADTRELVQLLLRQAGFRVSMTGDPAAVMQLLVTARFDALLLDN